MCRIHKSTSPAVPLFFFLLLFFVFCQTHSQYKITQATEREGLGGGKSTFLKHMHFQFPFCSVIKSSICTNHRGCLRPPESPRPTYLHTLLLSLTQPVTQYKQPDRHILTEHHKPNPISWFTCVYCWSFNSQ